MSNKKIKSVSWFVLALFALASVGCPVAIAQSTVPQFDFPNEFDAVGEAVTGFGASIAVDQAIGNPVDGSIALVGSESSIYAFTYSSIIGWQAQSQQPQVIPSGSACSYPRVAISGNVAVVGCPLYSDGNANGDEQGTIYIFSNVGGTWTQQARFIGATGVPINGGSEFTSGEELGAAVAVSGTNVLVGAPHHIFSQNSDGDVNGGGAVHWYSFANGIWTEQELLVPQAPTSNGFGFGDVRFDFRYDGDSRRSSGT